VVGVRLLAGHGGGRVRTGGAAGGDGASLRLHLARPASLRAPALILFASGDGGWFGTAIDMWRLLAREQVATAGFSARAFLKLERPGPAGLDPARLAREYGVLVETASTALRLPAGCPVILAGWSRGAAFSVLAAAESGRLPHLAGVIAVGLDATEDLAIDGPGDESDDGAPASPSAPGARIFHPYERLRAVHVPVAVIQATDDEYLGASAARALFGPDTPARRFLPVAARNHRFAGGTAALEAALGEAVRWVASFQQPGGGAR
jgi:hypothetical protein